MIKFHVPNSITFRDMDYYPVTDGRTDRQTESDAYEPTVQYAQVGSKMKAPLTKSVFEDDECNCCPLLLH